LEEKILSDIKIPFYLKLSIIISLLIITTVTGISYTLLKETKQAYKDQITSSSNLLANIIVKYSAEPIVMENYSSLTSIINNLKNDPDSNINRVSVTNAQGIIEISTDESTIGQKINIDSNAKSNRLEFNDEYLNVKAPIIAYDNLWGFLEFRYSLSFLNQMIYNTRYQIYLMSIIFIIFGLLISLIISKNIVKPINKLVESSRKIAEGDFNNPISVKSKDEFSFLAETLEEMRIDLKYFVSKVAKKAISYEGDLKIFNITTLLKLLNTAKHNGGLVLKQKNKFGIIYFKNGEIINAILDNSKGEKALFEFLHWQKGEFKFSPNLKSDKKIIDNKFNELLLNLARQIQSQKIFKQLIPSENIIIYPAVSKIKKTADSINLNSDEETILNLINGQKTLHDLRRILGWNAEKTFEIAYRLIVAGLITIRAEELNKNKDYNLDNIIPFPQNM